MSAKQLYYRTLDYDLDGYKEITLSDLFQHVGAGWTGIITQLVTDLFNAGWDGRVDQVKEKFGGLRFYIPTASPVFDALIAAAEKESTHVCEDCGKVGSLTTAGGWWVRTLCAEHKAEHEERQRRLQARSKQMEKL